MTVESDPGRGIFDELPERLGNVHESARELAGCLQKHDVSRKTDQSTIEADRCMFHKLLEEARDDLNRVTPRSQESLCTEIKQSKQRCSHTVVLKENPCPRYEEPSETSVHQTGTDTPLPQSSAGTLEPVIEDDHRKQLELSVPRYEPGEWKHEFKMLPFTTTILNLFFTEAEKKGTIRNFRMYIGPGSDVSSANKLSLDLKFNPCDTAITFRPEWRSMSNSLRTVRSIGDLVHMQE